MKSLIKQTHTNTYTDTYIDILTTLNVIIGIIISSIAIPLQSLTDSAHFLRILNTSALTDVLAIATPKTSSLQRETLVLFVLPISVGMPTELRQEGSLSMQRRKFASLSKQIVNKAGPFRHNWTVILRTDETRSKVLKSQTSTRMLEHMHAHQHTHTEANTIVQLQQQKIC